MVGTVRSGDHWVQSRNERKYPGLLSAAEQIAALTNRVHPVAARLAHGVQSLSALKGYSQVTTLVWRPSSSYTRTVTGDTEQVGRIRMDREFDDWYQLYSLQLCSLTVEDDAVPDLGERPGLSETQVGSTSNCQASDGRLYYPGRG